MKANGMFLRNNKALIILLLILTQTISAQFQFTCPAVEIKGGIAPILWSHCGSADNALGNQEVRGFKDHFSSLPWTVGFEISTFANPCLQFYFDFQYREANPKGDCPFTLSVSSLKCDAILEFVSPFRSASGYFGFDYYLNRADCCNPFSFFIGPKIGFTKFLRLEAARLECDTVCPSDFLCTDFCGCTSISGGGRVGFDLCLGCNLSFVFAGEFIAQKGRKLDDFRSRVAFRGNRTEFVFPIEFGFRYLF